jgi:hypothetical protein
MTKKRRSCSRPPRDLSNWPKFVAEHHTLGAENPDELIKVAIEWSLIVAVLEKDAAQVTPERQTLLGQCRNKALDALKAALAAGYKDLDKLRADPRLANLRDLPGFQKLRQSPPGVPKSNGTNNDPK